MMKMVVRHRLLISIQLPFLQKKAKTVLLVEAVSHLVKGLKYSQIDQELHLLGEFFPWGTVRSSSSQAVISCVAIKQRSI